LAVLVGGTSRSTFPVLERIVRDEDKRNEAARKLDRRAAEIGQAQPVHHRFRERSDASTTAELSRAGVVSRS